MLVVSSQLVKARRAMMAAIKTLPFLVALINAAQLAGN